MQTSFKPVPSFFQASNLVQLRSALKDESLFNVSPVRSESSMTRNISIDLKVGGLPEFDDDQSQNEPKTPTFF